MSTLLEYQLHAELTSDSCHVGVCAKYIPEEVGLVRGLTVACSGVHSERLKAGGGRDLLDRAASTPSACWDLFGVDCRSSASSDIFSGAEGSEPLA